MEIAIALLTIAVLIKMSRKPVPQPKPVRKYARFGAGQQVRFPVIQDWSAGNGWHIHDLNDRELLEMAVS